jgi:hypothetical protein
VRWTEALRLHPELAGWLRDALVHAETETPDDPLAAYVHAKATLPEPLEPEVYEAALAWFCDEVGL